MASGDSSSAAQMIRAELARRRMSRASLANAAKISLSALEKGLSGNRPFSEAALVRIGEVLNLTLNSARATTAPDELGGYARASVSWLEGNYLTIRPSAKRASDLVTYVTDITWDEAKAQLAFKELARLDKEFAQSGTVAVPHQTGHIYLNTNRHGQQRLMILRRETRGGGLYGLLLTLQKGRGAHLYSAAMPVALVPVSSLKEPPSMGAISPNHKAYVTYYMMLQKVSAENIGTLLGLPQP
jgi:transcriptional regulator with XRE-family HTH domain